MESHQSEHESEIKLKLSLIGQAKFRADQGKAYVRAQIMPLFELMRLQRTSEQDIQLHDIYFDTPDLDLLIRRASCRIRQKDGKATLTLKTEDSRGDGLFERPEQGWPFDAAILPEVMSSNGHHPVFQELRTYLDGLSNKDLRPVVRLINHRTAVLLTNDMESYEVAFDTFHIVDADSKPLSDDYFELELEAKNDPSKARLPDVRLKIKDVLKYLDFSTQSKYEFAMSVSTGKEKSLRSVLSFIRPLFHKDGLLMTIFAVIIAIAGLYAALKSACGAQPTSTSNNAIIQSSK